MTAISSGATASFVYDADGNRVKSTVGGVTTVYIAGVFEFIENGTTDKITTYYDGNAMRRSGYGIDDGVFYLLQDHLKSSSSFVNQAGATLTNNYYYPYGGNRGGAFSNLTTKRFTGQYHESSLPGGEGLSYYNARWYDAKLGRFLSADTLVPGPANPQAFNRYSYVLNNPLRFTDPTGHEPCANGSMCLPDGPSGFGESFDQMLRIRQAANTFRSGADYYLVRGVGLFDMSHVHTSKNRMNSILSQIGSGEVYLYYGFGESWTTGVKIEIEGRYTVQTNLSPEQTRQVALAIAMDFEHYIERNQSPGSTYSVEDLPSDYLGYFLALNPDWTEEEALMRLGNGRAPGPFGEVVAYTSKLFRQNREFRPIPGRGAGHVDWPFPFQMRADDGASGLWSANVAVTPDTRAWWQKGVDWGNKVWGVLFD